MFFSEPDKWMEFKERVIRLISHLKAGKCFGAQSDTDASEARSIVGQCCESIVTLGKPSSGHHRAPQDTIGEIGGWRERVRASIPESRNRFASFVRAI